MSVPNTAANVGQWQRVHPVTPVVQGWKALAALAALAIAFLRDGLANYRELLQTVGDIQQFASSRLAIIIAAVVGLVVVVVLCSYVSWRMMRFRITDDSVEVASGVLFRQRRQARLDRVQAIDIVRPLLARLAGLSQLNFQVAGGADGGIKLAYLKEQRALELRSEILAKAAGVALPAAPISEAGGAPDPTDGVGGFVPDAVASTVQPGPFAVTSGAGPALPVPVSAFPDAPETPIYSLDQRRLVRSILRSLMPYCMVVVVLVQVGLLIAGRGWGSLFVTIPGLLGFGAAMWSEYSTNFATTLAASPDGVRLRHGLLETSAITVPPGRVAGIALHQKLLWRRPGWWEADIAVAGAGQGEDDQTKNNTLVPVGTADEIRAALWAIAPQLGDASHAELLQAALSPSPRDHPQFICAPRRSRWLSPIAWRRHTVTLGPEAVIITSGRLHRWVGIIPHARVQSITVRQGPLLHRLRLASIHLDLVAGPVSSLIEKLDEDDAQRVLAAEVDKARAARRLATPSAWMRGRNEADNSFKEGASDA